MHKMLAFDLTKWLRFSGGDNRLTADHWQFGRGATPEIVGNIAQRQREEDSKLTHDKA